MTTELKTLDECKTFIHHLVQQHEDTDDFYFTVSPIFSDERITRRTQFAAIVGIYRKSDETCAGQKFALINRTKNGLGVALVCGILNWYPSIDNCQYSMPVDVSALKITHLTPEEFASTALSLTDYQIKEPCTYKPGAYFCTGIMSDEAKQFTLEFNGYYWKDTHTITTTKYPSDVNVRCHGLLLVDTVDDITELFMAKIGDKFMPMELSFNLNKNEVYL